MRLPLIVAALLAALPAAADPAFWKHAWPDTDFATNRAYTNYIRRLQQGTSGFTCFASLQMPRG